MEWIYARKSTNTAINSSIASKKSAKINGWFSLAHGQNTKLLKKGRHKAERASEHVDRAMEKNTHTTQQIKPTKPNVPKRAKHKHIECVLLLLTTTPAAHRKWMKQSGGKAFFSWIRMDFILDVFFVIRLGVRNEHKKLTNQHMHRCCMHLPCNRCSYSVFFSLSFSSVICFVLNVHMHMNDCFIASFFLRTSIKKEKKEDCFVWAHFISFHIYFVKGLRALLVLTAAVITKLILWIFTCALSGDRKPYEREKNQKNKYVYTRTRCSSKW